MIFITDELGNIEKNILELVENVGFKDCKTIEAIDLFCGMSEINDVLKEKDLYYAFIETPQYWSIRADGVNGAIYDNKTKMANIYFKNPIEKRMVSRVEWIDRNNTVYRIDYYNKYGYKYCSENVNGGNATVREFYDRNGDINVIEQTGSKTYTTLGTGISPRSYRGFSLCETFGLSLMEAVGDGLAMVGLDVRYGNRLFIHQDENGYLVDFDVETDFQNKDKLCERTAAAIVKIFEDDNRLKKFHENSYKIAEEYENHIIESKWIQLIKNILDLNPSSLILQRNAVT